VGNAGTLLTARLEMTIYDLLSSSACITDLHVTNIPLIIRFNSSCTSSIQRMLGSSRRKICFFTRVQKLRSGINTAELVPDEFLIDVRISTGAIFRK
jgi:hypothetical protein